MNPPETPTPELYEQLKTALLLLDEKGRLQYLNSAAEELLGMSRTHPDKDRLIARMLDSTGLDALIEHARRSERTLSAVGLGLGNGQSEDRRIDVEITPLADRRMLLEVRDSTLRRRARLDRDLRERRGLSRRVLQQLAHEFRNPLAGLRGAAQMLEGSLVDPDQQHLASIVCREVDRLDALIGELLSPTGAMNVAPCNIHAILQRLATLLRSEAGESLQVRHDYDPSLPEISLDENQLLRALINLGRNALQAGAGLVELRTRAARRLTWAGQLHRLALVVEIADDGKGVPQELAGSLFFPLVTSRADGTGLGLAISQEIVERHGGQIEFESEPGHTIFRLLLPLDGENVPT